MIDISELREAIQTFGSQAINEGDLNELLDRLEAAETDALEQARLNGMGAEREAALMARLETAEKERDNYKVVYEEWIEKTEWVQRGINDGTIPPKYLGWHRVDVVADLLSVAEKEANKINGRMVEVKKRLQLIVEEPSNTMSNTKAMREMLRQANLALKELK